MDRQARILIVDDNELTGNPMRRRLEAAGYELYLAANLDSALELAAQNRPDLVLVNAHLAGIEGREVCRQIKADPLQVDTFMVIMLNGQLESQAQPAGQEADVDDYIVRPITRRALLSRLNSMLARRSAREALRLNEEQLRQRLGQSSALNAALRETTLELISEHDLHTLLENIVRRAGQLVGTEAGFLHLVDANGGQLNPQVGLGALQDALKFYPVAGEGLAGRVWGFEPGLINAVVGVPLISDSQVVGVLGLAYAPPSRQTFGPEAIELLVQFARLATIAIENARLFSAQQQELAERRRAEQQVKKLNAQLELRVAERTTQLQAANRELETFAYSVSHDLRAPLRGIDGWSRALQEDFGPGLDEKARNYLERVRGETQRMAQLIDDLLKLSRVTSGEVRYAEVNLSALAVNIVERLRETLGERQVEFTIQPGLTALGDSRLLEIALTNLFNNACKFSNNRLVARVEFGQALQNGKLAYFVRDNGVGFDMMYAGKLFGAFQRMHSESEFPGTGIGLATVQRIVHRHGGTIWAEAHPDAGAVFYFTLDDSQRR